jgi:diguanylate cyclase
VMRLVAERLTRCVAGDGLLARFRGDEFGVYLEQKNADDVDALAKKICGAFEMPFEYDNLEFFLTAAIGIARFPDDGAEVHVLLKNAASAMTVTKDVWRSNYTRYEKAMGDASAHRVVLEAALRHAVERDELYLQFQPIVDLKRGGITGCEALVRWKHPQLGVISPDKFIPLADESGLIIELGAWVLRRACEEIKRLHDAGYDWLTLAVNVSAVQFAQPQLVAQIASVLATTGLEAKYLTVEITESVLMEDAELAIGTLRALKERGIKVAVDDFGTGYSSLAYLKRFSIDVLKIDRSFINDIAVDADSAAIVSAIAVLAKSLKLDVVAEGVETSEQLEIVRDIGCDRMQGYFFSRPLDIGALQNLVAERHPNPVGVPRGGAPVRRLALVS